MATDKSKVSEVEIETDEIVHEDVEDGVDSRLKSLEDNVAITQILADPDVRAVIEARRQGKNVKVVETRSGEEENEDTETEIETETETDPADELEDTDPLKGTIKRVGKYIDEKLDKKLAGIDRIAKQFTERLAEVENHARKNETREVKEAVNKARNKFEDFDQYRAPMTKLSEANPGLDVEELYMLAKKRAGKLNLKQPKVESERPSHSPQRLKGTKPATAPPTRPHGRRGFSEILAESLSDLDLSTE